MKKVPRQRTSTARMAAAASIAVGLSSCTFGTLPTSKCLEYYAQGVVEAGAKARLAGRITEEAYSYCADGRARIEATVSPLRAHGFRPSEPDTHFEVPGGWCLHAERRVVQGGFDAMRSLETVCAIGDSSRAYLTGGVLTSVDAQSHPILSTHDRQAREDLERRLEQNRR